MHVVNREMYMRQNPPKNFLVLIISKISKPQKRSNSIVLHQLSHTLERPRHPRFKYHFKRHRVGVGRFCECQFVDGGRRIGFDFKCPLHENGVYEDRSTKKSSMEYGIQKGQCESNKLIEKTGSDIRGGHMVPRTYPTTGR